MTEPDPKQNAALKDATLLARLSFAFAVLGIIALIFPGRFMAAGSNKFEPNQVMAVVSFTASVALGVWTFIRLFAGPRPFTYGFQLLVGFVFGNSIWILIGLGGTQHEGALVLFFIPLLLSGAGIITTDAGGQTMIGGIVLGCLMPILAMGVCALLL